MKIERILSELVSYNTVNNPTANVKPSAEILFYIQDEIMTPLGYKTYMFEKNGYKTLIGYKKNKGPKILFLGHCDVVPPGPNWETDPFTLTKKEGYGYGRGTSDMKGSVAVMLAVAKELSKKEPNSSTIFAFTLDEETGGLYGAGQLIKHLKKLKLLPNYVINGDTNGLQVVTRRRNPYLITLYLPKEIKKIRGIMKKETFRTEIAGNRTMHAAYFIRDLDKHCAEEAANFLIENKLLVKSISGTFVKNNVLPHEITVKYIIPDDNGELVTYDRNLTNFMYAVADLHKLEFPQTKPSDYGITLTFNYYKDENNHHHIQLDLRIMAKIDKIIKKTLSNYLKAKNVRFKIKVIGSIGPVATSDDSKLVIEALKVAENMNLTSKTFEMGGSSDSRWFSAIGIPTIEFGPIGKNIHGPNEAVKLDSLKIVKEYYLKVYRALQNA